MHERAASAARLVYAFLAVFASAESAGRATESVLIAAPAAAEISDSLSAV